MVPLPELSMFGFIAPNNSPNLASAYTTDLWRD